MLSSNLLKWNWVMVQPEEARVIDSNELVEKRLRDQGMIGGAGNGQEGFQSGLQAEMLEDVDSYSEGTVIKADPPEPVYDGPSPEELIAQAQEEIRQMQEEAQAQIEAARSQAIEDGQNAGREQGYQEGMARAEAEIADAKRQLEEAYHDKIRELEPAFIRELTGIYEHIFRVDLSEYRNLVLQLLESCMEKVESSGSYIVRVSTEDYPFVSMQKKVLLESLGNKNAALEVVEDVTMKKNECMIEADGGIYDCSLDVQLAALQRELRLLSYEGAEQA